MSDPTDVPSLTLRVLEKIQAELVGLRGDMGDVKTELKVLNTRFDHFLTFVGKDVQDLKARVAAVEQHIGLKQTP